MHPRELLRQIDIFSDLTDPEADAILVLMRERRLRRGSVVFHQWDEGGSLFLIQEGAVKISRIGKDGREVTFAVLREGNFFGEMSLLDGQPRSATATTSRATRVLVLEREKFLRGVLSHSRIVIKMLAELSKRIRAADHSIEFLALATVFDRLFHILGHLGRQFPITDQKVVIARRPTHQELSEMVGSSRETVTRTLASMERKGLIKIQKRNIVLQPSFFQEELKHL